MVFAGDVEFLPMLLDGLRLVEHELLLFASFWFVIGALDELAVDFSWLWLKLTGRANDFRMPPGVEVGRLTGRAAVFVPAWHEAEVIGSMVAHTLEAWRHEGLTLYVGCYRNDPETLSAAMEAAGGDMRLRLVVHDRSGPTTKADCLNRLYAALIEDERRSGQPFASIVLHDAEDMVHPAALALIDRALIEADFVQIPVLPEPQRGSPWVAGHYTDEFAEAHGKVLVVRDAIGAAIPAAGVGCGFARDTLARIAAMRRAEGGDGPFASECLTEDYELGVLVARTGGKSRFLRVRDRDGQLVATRAYFPGTLETSVRQKTRWIHGIALQGWDRLGWAGKPADFWMAMRDRRGPLMAVVLATAYLLFVLEGVLQLARLLGWQDLVPVSDELRLMLTITTAAVVWRAIWRFGFTAHEYGLWEGLRSILRIPVANLIAIMAGRRALFAYIRVLRGEILHWDKTRHHDHPAATRPGTGVGARAGALTR